MEQKHVQAAVVLKKGEGRSLKAGGAWIYDNEISQIRGEARDGDLVRVEDFDGYVMGQGFLNTRSKIAVRMMTRKRTRSSTKPFWNSGCGTPGITGKKRWTPAAAG